MWQAMRVMRRFTVAEIMATAEVGASAATKYVRFLTAGGYLRCVQARRSGYTGGHAQYQLLRDTGPCAPRIGKYGVRDPNTQPVARVPTVPTVTIPKPEYERALRCIGACEKLRARGVDGFTRDLAAKALEVAR